MLERAPSAHLASVLDIPDKRRQRSKVTGERGYLDFEIRSWIDLRVVGPLVYARHPSTEILCASWAIDDGPVQTWVPGDDPPAVCWARAIVAHNAAFELAAAHRDDKLAL